MTARAGRKLGKSLALMLWLLPGLAGAKEVYQCDFPAQRVNGGWIPEIVVVSLSDDQTRATVSDPIILNFNTTPIDVTVGTANDKRISMSWRLKVKNGDNQYASFAYRLTIVKAGLKGILTAQPLPYSNRFAAEGTCRKVKK